MYSRGFLSSVRWGRSAGGSVQLWRSTADQQHGRRDGFLPQIHRERARVHRARHTRHVLSQTHHTRNVSSRELDVHVSLSLSSDSYGNMTEDMKPFWHLARVAASFIMLRESSENTEYNMAQVANITQQVSWQPDATIGQWHRSWVTFDLMYCRRPSRSSWCWNITFCFMTCRHR